MGLSEVIQSEGWKKFQKKIYGWSAVLLIVGVLFKLAGKEGANIMIVVAVISVAVIFILSLFKPRGQQDKLNQ